MGGPRWFAWVTGIPIIWLVYAAGISGYWVVWDRLAQYVAISATEWLDAIPLFAQPIARNFLHPGTLSGRFFTLLVFIHIAVPLLLIFVMWLHIHRLSRPRVNPPRALAGGLLTTFVALSLLYPATSQGPADLGSDPGRVYIDWFYLAVLPLQDNFSGGWAWVIVLGFTALLLLVPWIPMRRRLPIARVDLENCNGCGRCVTDCPFEALRLDARSDGAPFAKQAVVDPKRCVGCGICVGACPTATPFRRRSALAAGIELPSPSLVDLRGLFDGEPAPDGQSRVLVVGCRHAPWGGIEHEDAIIRAEIPCVGMLPPSFIDFALSRRHAEGVLLAGCAPGRCREREGLEWTEQRIDGRRDPYLRTRVPRERIARCWVGPGADRALADCVTRLRERLRGLVPEGARGDEANRPRLAVTSGRD
jgi:ferredoxin/coenzyme F420-reducing hydrogenase delta subunit